MRGCLSQWSYPATDESAKTPNTDGQSCFHQRELHRLSGRYQLRGLFKDGLTIPHIDTEICVGCGGCEYVCPARPFRAVYIEGNVVQQDAKPFTDNHQEEIQVDDFGF